MESIKQFMAHMGLRDGEYLADGVYLAFDGWQLWLLTERNLRIESVALEPQALLALLAYAKQVGLLSHAKEKRTEAVAWLRARAERISTDRPTSYSAQDEATLLNDAALALEQGEPP